MAGITDAMYSANVTTAANLPTMEPLSLVTMDFEDVAKPMLLMSFFIIVSLVMIAYHFTGKVTNYFPETCVIIILGIMFGSLAYFTKVTEDLEFKLDSETFMIYLLPPIVLDAAYQLNNRAFTSNLGTVLLYAVVGTLVNFLFIGSCLFALSLGGVTGSASFTMIDTFLFASIIVAVDPVAVIAIFKAVGVNDQLYYLVFGESLLNDAVTIVLFGLMKSFTFSSNLTWGDIGMAIGAFFVSSLGAATVGFLVGVLSGVITKFTGHLRVLEPGLVYILAYWSYLFNEMLDWSGIIGLVVCCITQTQLSFQNMSKTSLITLENGSAVTGALVEATVFLFLGGETFRIAEEGKWNGMVILWTVVLCLTGRLISVFGLTGLANLSRHNKIPLKEQFVMWWAGLRGALAFALSATLHPQYEYRSTFISATIAFIFVTVFIEGVTMYPIVKCLKIEMRSDLEGETDEHNSKTMYDQKRRLLGRYVFKVGTALKMSLLNYTSSVDVKVPNENVHEGSHITSCEKTNGNASAIFNIPDVQVTTNEQDQTKGSAEAIRL